MLTQAQEKFIRSLSTKKGREKSGACLVEGKKVIETAGRAVEYIFSEKDSPHFSKLVTTQTPQEFAAVAKIPQWTISDIISRACIVVLDGVQDPGNVGSILRLCLGYDASLVLVESADVTNPKVIRSSVGSLFHVPWINLERKRAVDTLISLNREIYRLEKVSHTQKSDIKKAHKPCILIAGSEGKGIQLPIKGTSIAIPHNDALESLNVGHALAIVLYSMMD